MFLVAEAGVNHNGRLTDAFMLVDAAKKAGADAVKFQLFESKKLWGDDRIKHLELRYDDMEKIYQHCQELSIEFMCTPFGVAEMLFLRPMLKRIKIPSGLLTNRALLEEADNACLPIILSTGMSEEKEIWEAVDTIMGRELTILQCTSSYPCRLEDVNLRAMVTMRDIFKTDVGLSDHTTSITVPIAAAALGATIIEKHFTLDREATGPDHKTSITPSEFKWMRLAIIEVVAALGDGVKKVEDSEVALRKAWRK